MNISTNPDILQRKAVNPVASFRKPLPHFPNQISNESSTRFTHSALNYEPSQKTISKKAMIQVSDVRLSDKDEEVRRPAIFREPLHYPDVSTNVPLCPTTPRSTPSRMLDASGSTSSMRKIPFPSFVQVTPATADKSRFLAHNEYEGSSLQEASPQFPSFPSFFQKVTRTKGSMNQDGKRKMEIDGSLFLDQSDYSSSSSDQDGKKMRKLSLDDMHESSQMFETHMVLSALIPDQSKSKNELPPTPSIRRSRANTAHNLVTPSKLSLISCMDEVFDPFMEIMPLDFNNNLNHCEYNRKRSISCDETELECPKVLLAREYLEVGKLCPLLGEDIIIDEMIGNGAFAEVFKVSMPRFSNKYHALKRMKKTFRSMKDRERMMSEVHVMNQLNELNNPYIVKFHASWQQNGQLHILLEHAERGSMKDLIHDYHNRGIMIPDSTIWHTIHDVCSALAYIHSSKFVHLDIKPANLLLFNDGTIKVSDFGLTTFSGASKDEQEGDPR